MLEGGADVLASAIDIWGNPDTYPGVFHCSAGKDRTGVLAAVVLGHRGVSDDDMVDDYGLSGAGMAQMVDWFRQNAAGVGDVMAKQPTALLAAPPDAMRRVLDHLRLRFGSVEAFRAVDRRAAARGRRSAVAHARHELSVL